MRKLRKPEAPGCVRLTVRMLGTAPGGTNRQAGRVRLLHIAATQLGRLASFPAAQEMQSKPLLHTHSIPVSIQNSEKRIAPLKLPTFSVF